METITFWGVGLLVIVLANRATIDMRYWHILRWALYAALGALFIVNVRLLLRWLQSAAAPTVPAWAVWFIWASVNALVLGAAALVRSPTLRQRLRRLLPSTARYDPASPLHTAAVVIAAVYLSLQLHAFIIVGGAAGVAEAFQEGLQPLSLLSQLALNLSAAAFGVGLFIRRTWRQVLARLGLSTVSLEDVKLGLKMGVVLYSVMIALNIVGAIVFPKAASDATLDMLIPQEASIALLGFGFFIAASAAIGEETLFRGALQPVWGIVPTALFFALTHLQYTFTWASVIIFIVSLGFGYVRQRANTAAAIVAHFTYNFLPFLLLFIFSSSM